MLQLRGVLTAHISIHQNMQIHYITKSIGFGDAFLAQGLHLNSHQRCSAGIRTCLSADQSISSTLTESSFLFDPCLIHRGTAMLE